MASESRKPEGVNVMAALKAADESFSHVYAEHLRGLMKYRRKNLRKLRELVAMPGKGYFNDEDPDDERVTESELIELSEASSEFLIKVISLAKRGLNGFKYSG